MILEILWNEKYQNKKTNFDIININMSRIQGLNWLYVERDIDALGKGIFLNLDDIICWRIKEM